MELTVNVQSLSDIQIALRDSFTILSVVSITPDAESIPFNHPLKGDLESIIRALSELQPHPIDGAKGTPEARELCVEYIVCKIKQHCPNAAGQSLPTVIPFPH